MPRVPLALLSGCLALVPPLAGAAAAAPPEPFGRLVAERFGELAVPGLGFAVVEGDEVIEAAGLGVADASSGRPVTATTPFRVASLTKPLAAALLLEAVHRGAIDLDAPLRDASSRFRDGCEPMRRHFATNGQPYLDGIRCDDEAPSLGHVLTHTAGTPPGDRFSYNGFLFGLLDEAIGNASAGPGGGGFAGAVRRAVIEPLELQDTAAGVADGRGAAVVARLAPPHRRRHGRWVVGPFVPDPLNAGAGLISSAADLARIDVAYRTGLVPAEVLERATAPVTLADGSRSPYAAGWFVQRLDGREVVWHHGHRPGAYSALWIRDVAADRTLIALANGDGLAAGQDLHEGDLARSALARLFLDWSSRRAAPERPRPVRPR